jgi:uncharacterized protein YjiK
MCRIIFFLSFLIFSCNGFAQSRTKMDKIRSVKVKPSRSFHTEVKEPSDIVLHPDGQSYFIVSDNGFLYQVGMDGKIIRMADFEGFDTEAVCVKDDLVYIVEEMVRKIRVFSLKDLTLQRTVTIPYQGGRNKAYEAMTYNPVRNSFILITEKDPIYLFELDENLVVKNEIELKGMARDISAATYYGDYIWLLSDEDRQIIKLNPSTYEVIARWVIPVNNPEGIAFRSEHELIIVSDDMEKIYVFDAKLFLQ